MLTRDTQILFPGNQEKPITDFTIGHEIIAAELDGNNVIQGLEETYVRSLIKQDSHDFIKITHAKGDLLITPKQRVFNAKDNDWVYAENLKTTHKLYHYTGRKIKIVNIEKVTLDKTARVHTFSIKDYKNYFASGVLVHNTGSGPGYEARQKKLRKEIAAENKMLDATGIFKPSKIPGPNMKPASRKIPGPNMKPSSGKIPSPRPRTGPTKVPDLPPKRTIPSPSAALRAGGAKPGATPLKGGDSIYIDPDGSEFGSMEEFMTYQQFGKPDFGPSEAPPASDPNDGAKLYSPGGFNPPPVSPDSKIPPPSKKLVAAAKQAHEDQRQGVGYFAESTLPERDSDGEIIEKGAYAKPAAPSTAAASSAPGANEEKVTRTGSGLKGGYEVNKFAAEGETEEQAELRRAGIDPGEDQRSTEEIEAAKAKADEDAYWAAMQAENEAEDRAMGFVDEGDIVHPDTTAQKIAEEKYAGHPEKFVKKPSPLDAARDAFNDEKFTIAKPYWVMQKPEDGKGSRTTEEMTEEDANTIDAHDEAKKAFQKAKSEMTKWPPWTENIDGTGAKLPGAQVYWAVGSYKTKSGETPLIVQNGLIANKSNTGGDIGFDVTTLADPEVNVPEQDDCYLRGNTTGMAWVISDEESFNNPPAGFKRGESIPAECPVTAGSVLHGYLPAHLVGGTVRALNEDRDFSKDLKSQYKEFQKEWIAAKEKEIEEKEAEYEAARKAESEANIQGRTIKVKNPNTGKMETRINPRFSSVEAQADRATGGKDGAWGSISKFVQQHDAIGPAPKLIPVADGAYSSVKTGKVAGYEDPLYPGSYDNKTAINEKITWDNKTGQSTGTGQYIGNEDASGVPQPLMMPDGYSTQPRVFTEVHSIKSTIIDIPKNHHWTESPVSSRHQVPFLRLVEHKIDMNVMINQILNNVGVAIGKVGEVSRFMSGKDFSTLLGGIDEGTSAEQDEKTGVMTAVGDKVTGAVTSANEMLGSKKWRHDQRHGHWGKDSRDRNARKADRTLAGIEGEEAAGRNTRGKADPLRPYMGLYYTKLTGFKYKIPYMENQFRQGVGFKTGKQENPILQLFGDMAEGLANMATSLNVLSPGTYIEQPQGFNFSGREKSYTCTFPLFNTKSYEEIIKNWQFLFLLIYQNTPNRRSRDLIDPPCIYEASIPGMWYSKYACISNLSIEYMGSRRKLIVPVPFLDLAHGALDGNDDGWDDKQMIKPVETIIPDAYKVTIQVKELFGESQNFLYQSLAGNRSDDGRVTVGSNLHHDDLNAQAEMEHNAQQDRIWGNDGPMAAKYATLSEHEKKEYRYNKGFNKYDGNYKTVDRDTDSWQGGGGFNGSGFGGGGVA